MTATDALTSPVTEPFNESLRDAGGKSTPLGVFSVQHSAFSTLYPAIDNRKPETAFKVVLDAGHGGKDPGGMGKNSQEKHIALNIARLLAIGIRTNFPNVEVILTRSDDTFIPLHERAKIANEEGADLFISIHANIMPGSSATYGTETFVMGQHVARHNLAVAKRENASILLEDNVKENYGYDPNSDEGHIMMSTFQHAFLERSILFADLVEGEFKSAGRKSRGVKQAGFVVLKNTTMPSVLVETGFMSNPAEEAYLLSSIGQQKLANALLKAFNSYLKMMDKGNTKSLNPITNTFSTLSKVVSVPNSSKPVQKPISCFGPTTTQTKLVNNDQATKTKNQQRATVCVFDREITPGKHPDRTAQPQTVTTANNRQWTAKGVNPQPIIYDTPPRPTAVAPAPRPVYGTPVPAYVAPTAPALPPRSEASKQYESVLSREVTNGLRTQPSVYQRASRAVQPVRDTARDSVPAGDYRFGQANVRRDPNKFDIKTVNDSELTYAIQIVATKRTLDLQEARWQRIPYPIRMVREGEWNKYQVRGLASAADARVAREKVKSAGFPEAMVVVYYRGKRVAPGQVQYLLSR